MKKLLIASTLLLFSVSAVFAVPFAPTPLRISASNYIQYNFDGSSLNVPVTLTGTGASASFLVYTKGKAASMGNVTNGYLGWHQVNKIDTCIYASPFVQLAKGTNTIIWDGKDKDKNKVPEGEYTYYIFGFDNITPRIQMTNHMRIDAWIYRTILTHDPAGNPLANPVIYRSDGNRAPLVDAVAHTVSKWVIGSDPQDVAQLETTTSMGWVDTSGLAFIGEGNNLNKYYFHDTLKEGMKVTQKWEWVPNGASILDTSWGDNGQFSYTGMWPSDWNFGPGVVNDGMGTLFMINADISGTGTESQLIYVDINDGSEIKRFDMAPWWVDMQEGGETGKGQYCGGPSNIDMRNGHMFLNSHTTCVNQMLDPYAESNEDVVLWTNTNGDYTGDHNFEEGSEKPWVCNDYNVGPYKYNMVANADEFSIFSCNGQGAVSFGLYAPDGTGMNYHALAGESARAKMGVEWVDYGSPFDGIYTNNNTSGGEGGQYDIDYTIWYNASDSVKGTLSKEVGVADAAPSAFTVAQNSPNPFNPTTTITFNLAKAGKTTVEVYNVAGQKVSTLVNGTMSAGSHSVVWNAAKFSAGVYFYTVKSGSFSKTMKMTLLK